MAHHPGLTVTFGIPEGAVKVPAPKAKPIAPLMSARSALRDALRLMLRNDLVVIDKKELYQVQWCQVRETWLVYRDCEANYTATCPTKEIADAVAAAMNSATELIP